MTLIKEDIREKVNKTTKGAATGAALAQIAGLPISFTHAAGIGAGTALLGAALAHKWARKNFRK